MSAINAASAGIPLLQPGLPLDGGRLVEQTKTGGLSFEDTLSKMVAATDSRLKQSDAMAESFATGASDDIHGTMISLKEAEIDLRLLSNVRRKVLDAFHELWRMNV